MQSCFAVGFVATFASAVLVGSSAKPNCLMSEVVSSQVFYQLVLVIAAVQVGMCFFLTDMTGLLRPVVVFILLVASCDALATVLAASALHISWLYQDASSIIQAVSHNTARELVSAL
jgi:hypothetical protein